MTTLLLVPEVLIRGVSAILAPLLDLHGLLSADMILVSNINDGVVCVAALQSIRIILFKLGPLSLRLLDISLKLVS